MKILKRDNVILKTEQAFIPNILNSDKRTKNIDFKDVFDKLTKISGENIANEYKHLFDSNWGAIVSSTWFLKSKNEKDNIKIWSNFDEKILPLLEKYTNFNDLYMGLVNTPLPYTIKERYMSLYTWNKLVLLILYCSETIIINKENVEIIKWFEDFTFPYKRIFNHKDAVFQRVDTVPVIKDTFQKYKWIEGDFYNVNAVLNYKNEIDKILVEDNIDNLITNLNNSKDISKIFNKKSTKIFKKYRDDDVYTKEMLSYFQNDLTKNGNLVWIEIILQIFDEIFKHSKKMNNSLSFSWNKNNYGEFEFEEELYQIKNFKLKYKENPKENLVNYILIKSSKGVTTFELVKKM